VEQEMESAKSKWKNFASKVGLDHPRFSGVDLPIFHFPLPPSPLLPISRRPKSAAAWARVKRALVFLQRLTTPTPRQVMVKKCVPFFSLFIAHCFKSPAHNHCNIVSSPVQVGVGTCGIGGKGMTEYKERGKWQFDAAEEQ
jgi:hypothetical protein